MGEQRVDKWIKLSESYAILINVLKILLFCLTIYCALGPDE